MKKYSDVVLLIVAIIATQAIANWAGNRLGLAIADRLIARMERKNRS